jgi:hypothetical protein
MEKIIVLDFRGPIQPIDRPAGERVPCLFGGPSLYDSAFVFE